MNAPDPHLAPASAAQLIAAFACDFDAGRLNENERSLCARSLADSFGVALGGRHEHAALAALDYLRAAGLLLPPTSPPPAASLWGRTERAAPEIAAWWNGIAGHVLDYDDVTPPLRGHPSIVLWPALLALAESRGLPAARLAPAFAVGMEVICKLARGIAVEHYARGWHSTASIGALGAAVACGHLLGLDAVRIGHAIGLAVAQAAGTRENVGTEAKSFQAGHANAAGVRAACLAEAGFEAGPHALDGPHGYVALYAHGEDAAGMLADIGCAPLELSRAGLDVKQYPMCYATHRALDGLLALREQHGIGLAEVAWMQVRTSRGALVPLVHPHPRSGLEGKFSMQYAMAAGLADGAVRLTSFTDAAVQRPEVQAFFSRVETDEAPGPVSPRWAELELRLHDGRTLRIRVDTLHGSSQKPASDSELAAKLDDCLRWGRCAGSGQALLRRCLQLSDHAGDGGDAAALVHELQQLAISGDTP
ncbi:MmgE/PrpD family protein [Xylophilus rhododendri]|uniref:MmgE/PrpD family protein n=1 Tax=Xylophilus rhododendri TaxID=2697032 RepID=A0A857JDV1_9BURK|nr:MmgE/PrpD family protein [Xylophilus rhododendri]QHJ01300.1 MmgE/PrpD family protein [Xylophilus rhododendri]